MNWDWLLPPQHVYFLQKHIPIMPDDDGDHYLSLETQSPTSRSMPRSEAKVRGADNSRE